MTNVLRFRAPWFCATALFVASLVALPTRGADAPATAPATAPAAAAATPDPTPDPTGTLGGATSPLVTPNAYLAGQPDASVPVGGSFKATAGEKPTAEEAYRLALSTTYHLNFVWTLVAGFLVMFMQAGFALVETGLCRGKNAAHVMSMNFLVYALGMTGFFVSGYALMCGGANYSGVGGPGGLGGIPTLNKGYTMGASVGGDHGWLLFGTKGFMLTGDAYDGAAIVWFLFMMVFMDTTATIPTGALAERWKFASFFIFSLFVGGFIYPIYGCWVWGGGWLAQLGYRSGLAHGAVDYAGSGVVHLQGGAIALVCCWLLGPRIGKYDENGKPKAILGHNIPMVILGTFILAFGWFGFNAGSSLAGSDGRIGITAANTMLASASGALASCLYMWCIHSGRKPDPSMMCNGMLAGLVAITAPCAFVAPWAAFLIGGVAGVVVIWAVLFFEKMGIDDPVGAISVHGVNGAWGLIALGLFADGTYGAGWNNVGLDQYMGTAGKGVTGLFYGDSKQFVAQLIDVAVCVTWNVVVAGVIFFVIGKVLGSNRPAPEVEIAGLDVPEMGAPGYPEYITPIMPADVSTEAITAAKKHVKGVMAAASA
jgi:Amt family ammonium transporter